MTCVTPKTLLPVSTFHSWLIRGDFLMKVPEGACTNEESVCQENTHTDSSCSSPQGRVQAADSCCCPPPPLLPTQGSIVKSASYTASPAENVCAGPTLARTWGGGTREPPGTLSPADSLAAVHSTRADGGTAVLDLPLSVV